jgi:general secretion pathway protein B
MSFILDALQRADAERERGHVPGLRSHGTAPQTRTGPLAMGRRPFMLGATVLAVAAALLWWWSGRAPAPAPQAATAPTAATLAAAQMALAPPTPPTPALPILAPEPPPAAPPVMAPAPPRAPVATPAKAPPVAAAPTPARAPGALPAYVGGAGPEVKISGATYSENPAHRMLIANGLVVHEGQDIAPDLKLEVIGPRGAVLNHRGTRYNIHY